MRNKGFLFLIPGIIDMLKTIFRNRKRRSFDEIKIVQITDSVEVNLLKPNEAERLKMICRQSLVGKVLETWGGGSELMVSPIEETVESPTATKETFRYTVYAKFEPKNYWFGFRKW